MPKPISPTDPEEEAKKGRIAVWLEPDDILWLARHLAKGTDDMAPNNRIGRIYFRCLTALHKAGLPNDPWADEQAENK